MASLTCKRWKGGDRVKRSSCYCGRGLQARLVGEATLSKEGGKWRVASLVAYDPQKMRYVEMPLREQTAVRTSRLADAGASAQDALVSAIIARRAC